MKFTFRLDNIRTFENQRECIGYQMLYTIQDLTRGNVMTHNGSRTPVHRLRGASDIVCRKSAHLRALSISAWCSSSFPQRLSKEGSAIATPGTQAYVCAKV